MFRQEFSIGFLKMNHNVSLGNWYSKSEKYCISLHIIFSSVGLQLGLHALQNKTVLLNDRLENEESQSQEMLQRCCQKIQTITREKTRGFFRLVQRKHGYT